MEVAFVTLGVAYQMSMHSSQYTFGQTTAFLPVRAGTSSGALEFATEPTKFRGLEPGTSTRGDDACSLPTLFTVQISKRTNPNVEQVPWGCPARTVCVLLRHHLFGGHDGQFDG